MFYLIDKPHGISSQLAVHLLRRTLKLPKSVKMGHSGTLDPLATGGLLVAVGNSTRLLPLLNHDHKTYEFTARYDGVTASLDLDTPIELFDIEEVQRVGKEWGLAKINALLQHHFLWDIRQTPPIYSAANIDGQRAYAMARKGQTVELKERAVTIFSITCTSCLWPEIRVSVSVSGGTYVRSLARDIALKLWLPWGYVTDLRRTIIENLTVNPEVSVRSATVENALDWQVLFPDVSTLEVDDIVADQLRRGHALSADRIEENTLTFVTFEGKLLSVLKREGNLVKFVVNRMDEGNTISEK